MKDLTLRQVQILHYIRWASAINGFPPTFAEIADAFNLKSSTIFSHVQSLIKKGFLVKDPGKVRSLRLAPTQIDYEIGTCPKTKSLYLFRVKGRTAIAIARFLDDHMARQFAEDCAAALRITYQPGAARRIVVNGEEFKEGEER